jgi:hypothetical protein
MNLNDALDALNGYRFCAWVLPEGKRCRQGLGDHLHGPEILVVRWLRGKPRDVVSEACVGRHHDWTPDPKYAAVVAAIEALDPAGHAG